MTYIVHGEPPAMEALQASIRAKLGWKTTIPDYRDSVVLP
jgi:hypothetical protein